VTNAPKTASIVFILGGDELKTTPVASPAAYAIAIRDDNKQHCKCLANYELR